LVQSASKPGSQSFIGSFIRLLIYFSGPNGIVQSDIRESAEPRGGTKRGFLIPQRATRSHPFGREPPGPQCGSFVPAWPRCTLEFFVAGLSKPRPVLASWLTADVVLLASVWPSIAFASLIIFLASLMLAPVWPSGPRVADGRCACATFSSSIFHVAFLYFWPLVAVWSLRLPSLSLPHSVLGPFGF
jgi:hypothetical protein